MPILVAVVPAMTMDERFHRIGNRRSLF